MTRSDPVVDAVESRVYVVPTEEPESDGTFTWTSTTVVVAQVVAAGVTGLGFTYASAGAKTVIDDQLQTAVLGECAMDVPRLWTQMAAAVRNIGRPGIASAAIAAVDVALWDLKAKLLDLPLADLLGRCRADAPIYGSGGFTSYTDRELVDQLTGWVERAGVSSVKMKVGTAWGSDPLRDVARVQKVRAALGDGVALFVDANGGYGRKQAVRLAQPFGDAGVTWFEEPVSSDDLDGLRLVRDAIPIDVAAGEYGSTLSYFAQMTGAGAVDVLQADVSRCAGITEWLRVAAVAASHGLDLSGHCAQSLHAHPACSIPNLRHLEYFHDHERVDRLLFDGVLSPNAGALHPDPCRPGHGLELKEPDATPYRRH